MSFKLLKNNITNKFNQLKDNIPEFAGNLQANIDKARNLIETETQKLGLGEIAGGSKFTAGEIGVGNASVSPKTFKANLPAKPGPIGVGIKAGNMVPGVSPPPWPNELEDFASMNCIMTLAVLSQEEINEPTKTYRKNGFKFPIMRSGGGIGAQKKKTRIEQALGANVEFFIDNLELDSNIEPGRYGKNANVNAVTFEVLEPYSMGMFFQALKVGALKAGYKDYTLAPFALQLDFIGYDVDGKSMRAPYGRRILPIKITESRFSVNGGGSTYSCEGIAWNEQALNDSVQQVKTDVALKGRTIREMLQTGAQSLTEIMNKRLKDMKEKNQVSSPDQYVILFPGDPATDSAGWEAYGPQGEFGGSATKAPAHDYHDFGDGTPPRYNADPGNLEMFYASIIGSKADTEPVPESFQEFYSALSNKNTSSNTIEVLFKKYAASDQSNNIIGSKLIIDDPLAGGVQPMNSQGLADEKALKAKYPIFKRSSPNMQLSDDIRVFKFKAGQRIQEIIEEVLLSSMYGKNLAKQLMNITDPKGFVDWYIIETDTYIMKDEKELERSGAYPQLYVYRILPRKFHSSHFAAPTAPAQELANLKKECAKEYNYIYTGKNKDILDFEIQYNNAFIYPAKADKGGASASATTGAAGKQAAGKTQPEFKTADGTGGGGVAPEGTVAQKDSVKSVSGNNSAGIDDPEISVAREFNDRLLFSDADMINVEMTIMGDPFYISDSGIGNYHAKDTSYTNMNADGHMNHANSEVHINVLFRTPVDYDLATGKMIFPEDLIIVDTFSGIYRVTRVYSYIENNAFTQKLIMHRIKYQEESGPKQNVGALVPVTNPAESVNERAVAFNQTIKSSAATLESGANIQSYVAEAEKLLPGFQNLQSVLKKTQDILRSPDIQSAFGQVGSAFKDFQKSIQLGDLNQIGLDFQGLASKAGELANLTQLNLNGSDVLGAGEDLLSQLRSTTGDLSAGLPNSVGSLVDKAKGLNIPSVELPSGWADGFSTNTMIPKTDFPTVNFDAIAKASKMVPVEIPNAIESASTEAARRLQQLNNQKIGDISLPPVNLPRADLGGNIVYNKKTGRFEGGF